LSTPEQEPNATSQFAIANDWIAINKPDWMRVPDLALGIDET